MMLPDSLIEALIWYTQDILIDPYLLSYVYIILIAYCSPDHVGHTNLVQKFSAIPFLPRLALKVFFKPSSQTANAFLFTVPSSVTWLRSFLFGLIQIYFVQSKFFWNQYWSKLYVKWIWPQLTLPWAFSKSYVEIYLPSNLSLRQSHD